MSYDFLPPLPTQHIYYSQNNAYQTTLLNWFDVNDAHQDFDVPIWQGGRYVYSDKFIVQNDAMDKLTSILTRDNIILDYGDITADTTDVTITFPKDQTYTYKGTTYTLPASNHLTISPAAQNGDSYLIVLDTSQNPPTFVLQKRAITRADHINPFVMGFIVFAPSGNVVHMNWKSPIRESVPTNVRILQYSIGAYQQGIKLIVNRANSSLAVTNGQLFLAGHTMPIIGGGRLSEVIDKNEVVLVQKQATISIAELKKLQDGTTIQAGKSAFIPVFISGKGYLTLLRAEKSYDSAGTLAVQDANALQALNEMQISQSIKANYALVGVLMIKGVASSYTDPGNLRNILLINANSNLATQTNNSAIIDKYEVNDRRYFHTPIVAKDSTYKSSLNTTLLDAGDDGEGFLWQSGYIHSVQNRQLVQSAHEVHTTFFTPRTNNIRYDSYQSFTTLSSATGSYTNILLDNNSKLVGTTGSVALDASKAKLNIGLDKYNRLQMLFTLKDMTSTGSVKAPSEIGGHPSGTYVTMNMGIEIGVETTLWQNQYQTSIRPMVSYNTYFNTKALVFCHNQTSGVQQSIIKPQPALESNYANYSVYPYNHDGENDPCILHNINKSQPYYMNHIPPRPVKCTLKITYDVQGSTETGYIGFYLCARYINDRLPPPTVKLSDTFLLYMADLGSSALPTVSKDTSIHVGSSTNSFVMTNITTWGFPLAGTSGDVMPQSVELTYSMPVSMLSGWSFRDPTTGYTAAITTPPNSALNRGLWLGIPGKQSNQKISGFNFSGNTQDVHYVAWNDMYYSPKSGATLQKLTTGDIAIPDSSVPILAGGTKLLEYYKKKGWVV